MIENLWMFIMFSLVVTLISTLIKLVIINLKLSNIDEEEFNDYQRFIGSRIMWIATKNSLSRIITSKLLYFVPGHAIMLNIVFMYYALIHRGTYGIVKGIVASERLTFVPLIKFKYKEVDV